MMNSILVHVGMYADYIVPEHLSDVRMKKSGWPDKRYAKAAEYWAWVKEQENAERDKLCPREDFSAAMQRIVSRIPSPLRRL